MGKLSGRGASDKWRILVIDANALVRRGLAALIEGEPDLAVCAEAATANEGLAALDAMRPDLVIADFSREPGLGLDLVGEARARGLTLPIVLMSIDNGPVFAARARRAGASACVSKQRLNGELLATIRKALGGEPLPPAPGSDPG